MTLGLVLTSGLIFLFGLILLALFVAYFAEDRSRYKRIVGSVLTVALTGLSLAVIYPPKDTVRLGLDLEGGTSFLIRLMPEQGREIRPETLDKAVEVIRKRVDQFGVSEPIITPQGSDRILVQIAGLDPAQIEAARQQLGQVAKLEFRAVHPNSDALVPQIEAGLQLVPPGYRVESFSEEDDGGEGEKPSARSQEKLLVKIRPEIEGERVRRAFATFESGYGISLEFDSEGAELFSKYTAAHVGERFAIVLDGKIHSAPVIQTAIHGGHASITGHFTETEATNLAGVLENPLQNPVQIEEERSVSASLGADSIRSGLYAGVFGLIFTFLFVMIYYRFVGIVANLALIINIILLFGAMILFGSVLTLPGIAGVILSIGMAIDANVLIYERLREEMALGKPLKIAIRGAYDKAFTAIFDANVTTLITSIILFYFATGPVKGFAVTLTFGIIASMFSALLFTRNCFAWLIDTGLVTKVSMWNLIPKTSFDFLGKRNLAIALSLLMTIGSIVIFAVRGEKNFGVDFTGGDLLVLEATETADGKPAITENEVRDVLEPLNIDSVVQTERSAEKEFISVRSAANSNEIIQEALFAKYPEGLRVEQSDKVGKVVGDELARQSLFALALGMLGIFIYIAARFELSFGIAAGLATLHDVIVPIGVFALAGREVSLVMVGAVLTVAGYSVNDTIVVFDRIREGLAKDSKRSLIDIMNESINDTLSRTVLTGGTTIVAAFALYLFGGPVLNDFAFVILVGLFVAMFSSIFVASPLAYWWMQWEQKKRKRLKTEPATNPTQA